MPDSSSFAGQRAATLGLIIGVFLAALESSVVATAMPTVIRELGGQQLYALPFAVYLLVSTVSNPLWGRASDLRSRKGLYLVGILVFLLGSVLCGASTSMVFLIVARAVQGVGAGAVLPITLTIIGSMYSGRDRARVQAFISSVWGISGLLGPLLGGLMVDHLSWRWVFYLCVPFGVLAFFLVWRNLREASEVRSGELDWTGGLLFMLGSGLMVWGLEFHLWWMVGLSVGVLFLALMVERNHPSPLLPMRSLREHEPRVGVISNLLAGVAYFGLTSYIPLFAQASGGQTATGSGALLTPLIVGWTLGSLVGGRLMQRISMASLTRFGFALLTVGLAGFAYLIESSLVVVALMGGLMGLGMGFAMFSLLLSIQQNAEKQELGAITSAILFARSMGGAIGVAVMGLIIGQQAIGRGGHDLVLGLQRAFGFSLFLVVVAFVLSFTLKRVRPAESPPH
ncbi:MFS transporter [Deinococcus cellulosilyticus]|uniref:MFS transporter n=1 Tax=Deinococcus cellulosilyticus (strain DSM 18568 / NBRC 106333 / KACC 11606 / 5516J-15) TaxID=1223518 RepID=A0A511MZV0_DEIC1|nr:MFS transporter [Deinococcus cellulosilyticus]GEM46113.1 MFS transporter [Deinococcus cellulosilyticus NBRC 106333 = KACC 11606]